MPQVLFANPTPHTGLANNENSKGLLETEIVPFLLEFLLILSSFFTFLLKNE